MTRKQKAKRKRNEMIQEAYKSIAIEEIAKTFKLSLAQIYRIVEV